MKKIYVNQAASSLPIVSKAVKILKQEVKNRSNEIIELTDQIKEADIEVSLDNSIGQEGYRIGRKNNTVLIVGSDERGVMYGVGKFLHTSTFKENELIMSDWQGISVPKRKVRGIYFATHFHNFYHAAPLSEIEEYVESLALWGCNAIAVWFDMHHFNGIDAPEAQEMIHRLKVILKAANNVGIGAVLLGLANEGYKNSPEHLRADWTAGHDGYFAEPCDHYRCEICPNTQEGQDYIVQTRSEIMDAFADVTLDYLVIWPYDQGGCTCSKCAPWGSNGFIKCAKKIAQVIKEKTSETKIILSTWYFDHFIHGEWEQFDKYVTEQRPDWIDFLLADDNSDYYPEYILKNGVPGNFPLVSFPEISMYKMHPWGGYGANPMPDHFQLIWDSAKDKLAGGFPYSEGIYEDINKIICLQFFWGDKAALETVKEYASYEYQKELADDIVKAVYILEKNQLSSWKNEADFPDAFEILNNIEGKMTVYAKRQWRWRILVRRAEIDRELLKNNGQITISCKDACQELVDIFYAQNTGIGNAIKSINM